MHRDKAFLPNKAILAQRASKVRQPPDLRACEWRHNQTGPCYATGPPRLQAEFNDTAGQLSRRDQRARKTA